MSNPIFPTTPVHEHSILDLPIGLGVGKIPSSDLLFTLLRPIEENAAAPVPATLTVDNVLGDDTTGNGTALAPYATIQGAVRRIPIAAQVDRVVQLVNTGVAYTWPSLVYAWNRITIQAPALTVAMAAVVSAINGSTIATQLNYTFGLPGWGVDDYRGRIGQWLDGALAGLYGIVMENTANDARITSGKPGTAYANAAPADTFNILTQNASITITGTINVNQIIACSVGLVLNDLELNGGGTNLVGIDVQHSSVVFNRCRLGGTQLVPDTTFRGIFARYESTVEFNTCDLATRGSSANGMFTAFTGSRIAIRDGSFIDGRNVPGGSPEFAFVQVRGGCLTQRGSTGFRSMTSATVGAIMLFGGSLDMDAGTNANYFGQACAVGYKSEPNNLNGGTVGYTPDCYGALTGNLANLTNGDAIFVGANSTVSTNGGPGTVECSADGGTTLVTSGMNDGTQIIGATVSPPNGTIADPGNGAAIPVVASVSCELTIGAGVESRTIADPTFALQVLAIRIGTTGGGSVNLVFASAVDALGGQVVHLDGLNQYALVEACLTTGGALAWRLASTSNLLQSGRPWFETAESLAVTTIYVDNTAGSDVSGTGTAINPFASIEKAFTLIPVDARVDRIVQLVASATNYTIPYIFGWNRVTIQGPAPTIAEAAVVNADLAAPSTAATQIYCDFVAAAWALDSYRGRIGQWDAATATVALRNTYGTIMENNAAIARITSGKPGTAFTAAAAGDIFNVLTQGAAIQITGTANINHIIGHSAGLTFNDLEFNGNGTNSVGIDFHHASVIFNRCRLGGTGAADTTFRGVFSKYQSTVELNSCDIAMRGTSSSGMAQALSGSRLAIRDGSFVDGRNVPGGSPQFAFIQVRGGTLTQRGSIGFRSMTSSTVGAIQISGSAGGFDLDTSAFCYNYFGQGCAVGYKSETASFHTATVGSIPACFGSLTGNLCNLIGGDRLTLNPATASTVVTNSGGTPGVAQCSANGGTTLISSGVADGTQIIGASVSPPNGTIADPGNGNAIPVVASTSCALTVAAPGETRTVAAPTFAGQRLTIKLAVLAGGADVSVTFASSFDRYGNTILQLANSLDEYGIVESVVSTGGALVWRLVQSQSTLPGQGMPGISAQVTMDPFGPENLGLNTRATILHAELSYANTNSFVDANVRRFHVQTWTDAAFTTPNAAATISVGASGTILAGAGTDDAIVLTAATGLFDLIVTDAAVDPAVQVTVTPVLTGPENVGLVYACGPSEAIAFA